MIGVQKRSSTEYLIKSQLKTLIYYKTAKKIDWLSSMSARNIENTLFGTLKTPYLTFEIKNVQGAYNQPSVTNEGAKIAFCSF